MLSAVPRLAPSSKNCTLATPTLSDALAETVTVPAIVAFAAGAVSDTVGAVASGPDGPSGVTMSVWI